MEGGPSVITDLQGAFRLHYTCQRIASVLFGFPGKVNWTSILISLARAHSLSQLVPIVVFGFLRLAGATCNFTLKSTLVKSTNWKCNVWLSS